MKTAATSRVDFNDLTESETGDIIRIHFTTDGMVGITSLLGMIAACTLESPDHMPLRAIEMSRQWDSDANRYVELVITGSFDQNWFTRGLRDHIDQLEFVQRTRPLVDTRELSQVEAVFNFRFKPRDFEGLTELLELNELGVITLDDAGKFERAYLVGDWEGRDRAGQFTSHLLSQAAMEYHDYFMTRVAPHLEMLRN